MKSTLKLYILDLDKFLRDKTKPSLGLSLYNDKKWKSYDGYVVQKSKKKNIS